MEQVKALLQFIDESPTAYHSVENASKMLEKEGFKYIPESKKYQLKKGGKYYTTRNGTSLIAFKIGENNTSDYSFNITASHGDSPTFKVKPNNNIDIGKYQKVSVEAYGGMLCSTWFDRPLSIAGRVSVSSEKGIDNRLVNIDRDLLVIPNMAIHMNRMANEGFKYNLAIDMQPMMYSQEKTSLTKILAKELDVKEEDIVGQDLFLYNRNKSIIVGENNEIFLAPRIDDLECGYTTLVGFIASNNNQSISVYCLFDNEEVGSHTRQGAASTFLSDTLERINSSLGYSREDLLQALSSSFLVSSDNAHAVHPNHPELSDALNKVYMNEGIVIKHNAAQSYTTDGVSSAVFKKICQKVNVPVQHFTNRADLRGGGTLGNISTSQVSIMSVDIGLAQLAMHSAYELAGVKDVNYMIEGIKEFYNTVISLDDNGNIILK
ncbi:MAG: M18 family aminopeptidase [Erysipelotrichaceae bacterium]|nr:M18 family aminopeptidase [Erysipelotrichaceae bacterium]